MTSVKDVSGIPTEGKNLIIVAAVGQILHFRMFDGDGKKVVDTDERRLTGRARPIEDLRKQLVSWWPPHKLTGSEKGLVIGRPSTSIVGHARFGQTAATVQRPVGDLRRLEERVRRTAEAVLPSVVAVRNPSDESSKVAGYQNNYSSGVIITADGIVLSQGHVSHWKFRDTIRPGTSPTGSAGERTTVILHDGRECPAELLGANRTHDVSLLRLLEPGPYPHVPIRATAPVEVGDWVLKIGHPLGYRKGRSAPVRLGRVICGTAEIFGTDCMLTGGDSGGPYFSLDGQLVGIMYYGNGNLTIMYLNDASFFQRNGGWSLMSVTGSKIIASLLDAMRRGEISPDDRKESVRIERELEESARLQAADFSQGSASLARYRSIVEPTRASVVVVLNAGVAVGLGTIVGAEGWVITKASELPGQPMCRLPDGKIVSARVVGVDPAFDLALLLVPATDLKPQCCGARDFNPQFVERSWQPSARSSPWQSAWSVSRVAISVRRFVLPTHCRYGYLPAARESSVETRDR